MTHTVRLPKGWASTLLGSVFSWGSGGTPRRGTPAYYNGDIPWAIIGDLSDGTVNETATCITERGLNESSAKWVKPDSVLIAMYGSIGKLGINSIPLTTNQAIAFTKPDPIPTKYLFYYLMRERSALVGLGKGGTQRNISQTVIKAFPFVVAPLSEQHRIVEAIESYLTRLDDAVASLERVQRNLERYRASVLKAAVEGRLVPAEAELAREEGRSYEPADVLLERILAERKVRWIEDAAEKARANAEAKAGKAGKPWTPEDDTKALAKARKAAEAKYKEPAAPETTDLPTLPEGWCWSTVEQTAIVTGGITKNAKRTAFPLQVPYLRVANVYADELRLDDVREIGVTDDEFTRTQLQPGDMLVVEGNGSVEQIGRVALWNGEVAGCSHQNHLIRARFVHKQIVRWALQWLLSRGGRIHVQRVASSTSGLHTLSISKVSALPVPLPPLAESLRLIAEIDRQSSLASDLDRTLEASLARMQRLRQSVLKWAFEGKLVEQDPNDEPASLLLERIRSEIASAKQ